MKRIKLENKEIFENEILISSESLSSDDCYVNPVYDVSYSSENIEILPLSSEKNENTVEEENFIEILENSEFNNFSDLEILEDFEIGTFNKPENYVFPHLRENEKNVINNVEEQNKIRRLYDYILSLNNLKEIKKNIFISFLDLIRFSIENEQKINKRLKDIFIEIKTRIEKKERVKKEKAKTQAFIKIDDPLRTYGTLKHKKIKNVFSNKKQRFNSKLFFTTREKNKENISIHPSLFFEYIENKEILELMDLYKVISIAYNFYPFNIRKEVLVTDFSLDSRDFVELIFKRILMKLVNKNYIEENYNNSIEKGEDIFKNNTLKLSSKTMVLLKLIDDYGLINIGKEFKSIISYAFSSFFKSQFSLFVLLSAYNVDISLIKVILSNLFSEKNLLNFNKKKYTPQEIEKIFKAEKIKSLGELDDKACSICLEVFVSEAKVYKMNCNHIFHVDCINNWLKNSNCCPFCKEKVESFEYLKKNTF